MKAELVAKDAENDRFSSQVFVIVKKKCEVYAAN